MKELWNKYGVKAEIREKVARSVVLT